MVVGEVAERVDLLVVGAGPGGYAAAIWAAQRGRSVTLVDRRGPDSLGGVCLQEGCIPSKLLIDASRAVTDLEHGAGPGLTGDVRFDPSAFQHERKRVIKRLSRGVGSLLSANGVDVRHGSLRFTRPGAAVLHTPRDQAEFLEFQDVVIATGSRPIEHSSVPFDHGSVLGPAELLALDHLPGSLMVIGADYIGLELGTAYAKFGVEVTIVEQADQVLPELDRLLVRPVAQRLGELGVRVLTSTRVVGTDGASVRLSGPDGASQEPTDLVLVSVGRRPNTDDLGLTELGITPRADERLDVAPDRRLTPHVAAIGDCTPGPCLAHKATAEARVAVASLCGEPAAFDPRAIPQVVFCDPPIATAGSSVEDAERDGIQATAYSFPLSSLGRAIARDDTRGSAQLVVEAATGVLIGAQLVGCAAPELIAESVLAIEMAATVEDLSLTIHPHPTLSEQLAEVAHQAAGMPLHTSGGQRTRRR